jgi:Cys-rich protein (TIGR01571 family)
MIFSNFLFFLFSLSFLGSILQEFDGANYCIGCCCVGVVPMRWMVRTGYNIEGNAHYDCWSGACCSPCAVNQMLQTVKQNGRVQIPQVGPSFNNNPRKYFYSVI